MLTNIASITIIGTAVWLLTTDPAHKFHHTTPPATVALAKLPVKPGTTDAKAFRMALNEAAVMIGGGK